MEQTTGLKRSTSDKYYTKPDVVNHCIELLKKKIKISNNDLVIEPSAGNGSFITGIKEITNNFKFYDIEPDHLEIEKKDYLEVELELDSDSSFSKIHVLGNPPFGRQSSLAIKFIKKSAEFADTIAFILPKSFKKDSMQKHFPLDYHLICQEDLPKKSFLVNDLEFDVPCIFQIWVKKDIPRKLPDVVAAEGFEFVKKNESPDISFRRVGVNAGVIDTDYAAKSEQSHYFIKFHNIKLDKIITKLKNIKFTEDNTVGPKSISKQEIIKLYNQQLSS
jgi:predicted RNA methylase